MPNIGAPELLILLVLLAVFGACVFTVIDVARRPEADFAAVGQNRTLWLIVGILSLFVPCVWLGSVYSLLGVRPKLATRS